MSTATLDPRRTVLVAIDFQEKLLPVVDGRDQVLHNARLLLRLAEILELPRVLTTQYAKGLGGTVPEIVEVAGAVAPLDKVSFGCFGDPGFLDHLKQHEGRDQLVVAGIETHICVNQTVLGALGAGYQVHVASDAVGSRAPANHAVGLARMERAGAQISSAEMAIYELLGRSDGAAFKKMLPHLK